MNAIPGLLAAVLLAAHPLHASQASEEENAAGQALASELRSGMPATDSEIHGTLIIVSGDKTTEVPVSCQVKRLEDGTWETLYRTKPQGVMAAEELVVIHSTNGPNRYLYTRAASATASLPQAKPLPEEQLSGLLAGSDFSFGELGMEFLHWPQQLRLKGQMRLGQPCYVLESRNPRPGPIARIRSYIDEESGGLLLAEAYDAEGRIVKTFSLHGSSFKKVNGQWRLEKMEMRDKNRHSRTTLKFDINEGQ